MARYVLKYRAIVVAPNAAFPARRTTQRPYVAIDLFNGTRSFRSYALIDSGADDCIFPASFARQLGLNYLAGRHYPFGGAGDGNQDAYFFDLELDIIDISRYAVPIGFSPSVEKFGHGVLGQNGFFDRFSLSFHLARGVFSIYTR